jgi:hypothetical protein
VKTNQVGKCPGQDNVTDIKYCQTDHIKDETFEMFLLGFENEFGVDNKIDHCGQG